MIITLTARGLQPFTLIHYQPYSSLSLLSPGNGSRANSLHSQIKIPRLAPTMSVYIRTQQL